MVTNFDAGIFQADVEVFKTIFAEFVNSLKDDDWSRPTGERPQDWTVQQTLAHLVSIGEVFLKASDSILNQYPLEIPGLVSRHDLADLNQAELERLSVYTPAELTAQLMIILDKAVALAHKLTAAQLSQRLYLQVYNRPARLQDYLDWQLSHAGVVHAAQIVRPLAHPPLWEHYPPAMLHRQQERFVRHMSFAYWGDYGPSEEKRINFEVETSAGGQWYLTADPAGGSYGTGNLPTADYTYIFESPAVFLGLFTVERNFLTDLGTGQVKILPEAATVESLKLMRLFSATPPRKALK